MRLPHLPAILLLIIGSSVARTTYAQNAVLTFPAVSVDNHIIANNVPATISIDGSDPATFDQTVSCDVVTPAPGGWFIFGLVFLHADTAGTVYGTSGIAGLPALGAVPHQTLHGCWLHDGTAVTLRITTSELGCASPALNLAGDYNGDGVRTVGDLFAAVEAFCLGRMTLDGVYEFLRLYLA